MNKIERPKVHREFKLEWTSDVAAQMLRDLQFPYIAMNPGASYRGLHDSLVNYLGNERPRLLLCLNEDHVVSIAHGYAKATDQPMACILHGNVGLLHGSMGIFNAWCDRAPMVIVGATGPVAPEKRRPWIDWIHTAKDQGALVRDFTKWDDEPRSADGIVEAFLRGRQLTSSSPKAPVYICLDAGLQEEKLYRETVIPDASRYLPPALPCAGVDEAQRIADLLLGAKNPVILFGRGSRAVEAWHRRVRLAELTNATVLTSLRERSIFPTDHPLHAVAPVYWLTEKGKEVIRSADVIVSFDWADLNGLLLQVNRKTFDLDAKVCHVSLDSILHRGWSMDYFSLPPVDLPVMADPDAVVEQVVSVVEQSLNGKPRWDVSGWHDAARVQCSENASREIAPRDIEVALETVRANYHITLAHVTIGWSGAVYQLRHPLDFLGHDGGGGLAAGPGLTIGAALALRDTDRVVVGVIGDGDFLQGVTALWTAAHYRIPALFIISNNRSNFNDEVHQEAVAKIRGRPVENRWIGQRIADPELDLVAMARAQGVEGMGPVTNVNDLNRALARGLEEVKSGRPFFIDAHVELGYASAPLSRGE